MTSSIRHCQFDKNRTFVNNIRPSDPFITPNSLPSSMEIDLKRLYDLIWRRTLASQMKPSINLETTINIKGGNFKLRARGNITKFKGFKQVYNYSESNEELQNLPDFKLKDDLFLSEIESKQNFTKPPNRFSEAGLIKKLEELGIGRPSTYVSIFTKLED